MPWHNSNICVFYDIFTQFVRFCEAIPPKRTWTHFISSELYWVKSKPDTVIEGHPCYRAISLVCVFLWQTVTVLVREVKYYQITTDQLQVLLGFCDEDIHDFHRQSTAFTLLKAILSRKLNIPEVHELMLKVQNMSVTADSAHTRRECRQVTMATGLG